MNAIVTNTNTAAIQVNNSCHHFFLQLVWVLDWNQSAKDFYQSLGAEPMDDWTVNRVTGDALSKLASQFSVEGQP